LAVDDHAAAHNEFKEDVKLSLASILALSIAAPVQAQNPKQGDYYAGNHLGCRFATGDVP
jgi:hypothetical protein